MCLVLSLRGVYRICQPYLCVHIFDKELALFVTEVHLNFAVWHTLRLKGGDIIICTAFELLNHSLSVCAELAGGI